MTTCQPKPDMRNNELRTASGYIEALMDALKDTSWNISGIVVPSISNDSKTASFEYELRGRKTRSRGFVRTEDKETIGQFGHGFVWQDCQYEDSYYGQILLPIEDQQRYVVIDFQC